MNISWILIASVCSVAPGVTPCQQQELHRYPTQQACLADARVLLDLHDRYVAPHCVPDVAWPAH